MEKKSEWVKTFHGGPVVAPETMAKQGKFCYACRHWWRAKDHLNDGVREHLILVGYCRLHGYLTVEDMYCGLWSSVKKIWEEVKETKKTFLTVWKDGAIRTSKAMKKELVDLKDGDFIEVEVTKIYVVEEEREEVAKLFL